MSNMQLLESLDKSVHAMRKVLSEHINEGNVQTTAIQQKLTKIEASMVRVEDLTEIRDLVIGHKIKIGLLFGAFSAGVMSIIAWITTHLDKFR